MRLVPLTGYLGAHRGAEPDALAPERLRVDCLGETSEGFSVSWAWPSADHRASLTGMGIIFACHHLIAQSVGPERADPVRRFHPQIAVLKTQVGRGGQLPDSGTHAGRVRACGGRSLDEEEGIV